MLNLGMAFLFYTMTEINKYLIIVAGGTGTRMNHELPKQFLLIHDKPVIVHTIKKFISTFLNIKIIIVIHSSWKEYLIDLLNQYQWQNNIEIVLGGETRFHSVKHGLAKINLEDSALVAVHDAARPMVSSQTIVSAFESAKLYGSGIPVIDISESLRQVSDNENKYLDRSKVKIVQTPQCFQLALLQKGFEQAYDDTFTDDASVIEKLGLPVFLTKGNQENIKITWPIDLKIAEAIIQTVE
jgi:2-C-methyl-D-erythritol 4-phosphate cytidylyltransferase